MELQHSSMSIKTFLYYRGSCNKNINFLTMWLLEMYPVTLRLLTVDLHKGLKMLFKINP